MRDVNGCVVATIYSAEDCADNPELKYNVTPSNWLRDYMNLTDNVTGATELECLDKVYMYIKGAIFASQEVLNELYDAQEHLEQTVKSTRESLNKLNEAEMVFLHEIFSDDKEDE